MNEVFIEGDVLELIEKWKEDMTFSGEGMGWILSSLIAQERDYGPLVEKTKDEGR